MSPQIFKNNVPNENLFSLLEAICIKTDKCYIFNTNSFKKGVFNDSLLEFINECKPYYHLSKQKYLEKKLTYNTFTTILRQICNFNNINYTSQIKYDKSNYEIIYYVYF
jgi:hypothetical protein